MTVTKRQFDSKLILFEGMLGSGKSTAAQMLAVKLREQGFKGRWYHERSANHPINSPLFKQFINLREYSRALASTWKSFVAETMKSGEIPILEAGLFQHILPLAVAQDLDRSISIEFILQIKEIIRPLHPILIYFTRPDVDNALKDICDKRGYKWQMGAIQKFDRSPVSRRLGIDGYGVFLHCVKEIAAISDLLFDRFDIKKINVNTSPLNRKRIIEKLFDQFALPLKPDHALTEEFLSKFVGTYKAKHNQNLIYFLIQHESNELVISGFEQFVEPKKKLVHKDGNTFYPESFPIEMRFKEIPGGVIDSVEMDFSELLWDIDLLTFSKSQEKVAHRD